MKKVSSIFKGVLLLGSLIFALALPALAKNLDQQEYVPDQLIIKVKQNMSTDVSFYTKYNIKSLDQILKQHLSKGNAKKAEEEAGLNRLYLAKLGNTTDLDQVLNLLNADPAVQYAEPNYIVHTNLIPNDPGFSRLWGMNNTGQTGGTVDSDIDAPEAWAVTHDSNLVVGIIDTGVDYTHPDLMANIWTNPGEIAGNGIDDDGNGFIDDIYGWDFVNNDNSPMDDYGHGTHVAGTIAGVGNNGIGIAGINWNGKVASLKFLDSAGSGTTDNAVKSVQYANMMGFKITSNSWGGGGFSQALYDAISAGNAAGNLFVAAAGNSGVNADRSPMYPAAYNLLNIISVAATDHNDLLASFSNYGATSVDLGAPGVNIYSTVPTGTCTLCNNTGYATLSGTSMATPHVSGAVALLWSYSPNLGYLDVKNKIMHSSDIVSSLVKTVSGGRLNIFNFVEADAIAPSGVTNLAVQFLAHNSVTLNWTAVGDDGLAGTANRYDVRYSTSTIDAANFDSALQATGETKPSSSGVSETFTVKGLLPTTTYYFALKVSDNVGNASVISNVVSGTTLSPVVFFSDNIESGTNGWAAGGGQNLWHQSSRRSLSPMKSWYYGLETTGTYDTGKRNYGGLTSPVIDLSKVKGAELSFNQFLAVPYPFLLADSASVQVLQGRNGYNLLTMTWGNATWSHPKFDISQFDGSKIQIRFYFDTHDKWANNFEGWYVDDVQVIGTPTL